MALTYYMAKLTFKSGKTKEVKGNTEYQLNCAISDVINDSYLYDRVISHTKHIVTDLDKTT